MPTFVIPASNSEDNRPLPRRRLREYSATQPRVPAGSPEGGEFASSAMGMPIATPPKKHQFAARDLALAKQANERAWQGADRTAMLAKIAEIRRNALIPEEKIYAPMIARAELDGQAAKVHGDSETVNTGKDGDFMPDRQALHNEIVKDALLKEGVVSHPPGQPTAVLLAGMTASGKTTAAGKMLEPGGFGDRAIYINNDDVKGELAKRDESGRNAQGGLNADYLHEESSKVGDRIYAEAVKARKDMILDSVFKSLGGVDYDEHGTAKATGLLGKIHELQTAGYRVEIRYVWATTEDSIRNNLQRYARQYAAGKPSRYVPVDVIKKTGKGDQPGQTKPYETFLSVRHVVDAWSVAKGHTSVVPPAGTLGSHGQLTEARQVYNRVRGRLRRRP